MASQLLGPSLDDLLKFCGGKFSLKTTLLLAVQMLDRIEIFHSIDFIHRDIKPENFCVGLGKNKDTTYVIDFGLAKRYSDPRTGLHIRYQESKGMTGTARYVSINSHLGIEQSRRDDLESIGYVLIYFLRGNLPWEKLEAQSKLEKFRKIMETKINTPIDELCRGYPDEFQTYLEYCRNLRFEEKPDYAWVKNLFTNLYYKHEDQWDNVFDWSYIKNTKLIIEEEKPNQISY